MLNSSSQFQRLLLATVYGFALLESPAFAQSATSMGAYVQPGGCGSAVYPPGISRPITQDGTGTLCTQTSSGGGGGGGTVTQGPPGASGWPVIVSGVAGTPTQTGVSVTSATTALTTSSQFSNFGRVCVPSTAGTGIWVNWAGVAAVAAIPSDYIPPGQCDIWVKQTGFLPTTAWNAISNTSATVSALVIGN